MRNKYLPTDFFPDYFKMDLGVGTSSEHVFTKAIDESLTAIGFEHHKNALFLTKGLLSEERVRAILTSLNYTHDCLSGGEVETLFSEFPLMYAERGTLSALRRLCGIYFNDAKTREIFRGTPIQADAIGARSTFPLRAGDDSSRAHTVFIRLYREASPDRIQEFLNNTKELLPHGFKVEVALPEPTRSRVVPPSFSPQLRPFRLMAGQLTKNKEDTCPTFPK